MSKVTEVSVWKKNTQGVELTVPSGNVALVRPVGMQVFIQKGMIPNSLMPIVKGALAKGKVDKSFYDELDEKLLADVIELMDAITCYCVVEPKVIPAPPEDEERNPNLLYVDEVDMEDKTFIFQFAVGGTKDLESFRDKQDSELELISNGKKPKSKTQRANRAG